MDEDPARQPVDDIRPWLVMLVRPLMPSAMMPRLADMWPSVALVRAESVLRDIQRLVKIIRSLAQILCGIAQGIQTRLNGGIAGTDVAGVEAQLIQNIFQIAQLVAHIAKRAGHAGKGRSHLGIALLQTRLAVLPSSAPLCVARPAILPTARVTCFVGESQLAVIGQQRGAPQQTQAGGQQLHLAAHAGAQREDAHGGIRHLQQEMAVLM